MRGSERFGVGAPITLATGEVEIAREIAPLLLVALADRGEPAPHEELSQVCVREETLVRRIPRRLELVERGAFVGIVWRELVDDEHLAARPRNPC